MMIFLNLATKKGKVTADTATAFIKLLSPFAPHLAEELWHLRGNRETITYEPWPVCNDDYLKEEMFEYPVSFNGKMRFKLELPTGLTREEITAAVLADERSQKWMGGNKPSNIVVVPNRIVNIVTAV
jgi:leucyl-tRNA synthetase